jgi:hypothetical protein
MSTQYLAQVAHMDRAFGERIDALRAARSRRLLAWLEGS